MKLKRWAIVVILAAFLLPVAGYTLEGAWAQETSQLQMSASVGDPQLLAKGVGVSVPFNITCSGAIQVTYFWARLTVLQRMGKSSVEGTAYVSGYNVGRVPVCDGQAHTFINATVIPETSGIFKKGSALVTGSVELCAITDTSNPDYPGEDCVLSTISQEVRIR
jgi:hypothetical protein